MSRHLLRLRQRGQLLLVVLLVLLVLVLFGAGFSVHLLWVLLVALLVLALVGGLGRGSGWW